MLEVIMIKMISFGMISSHMVLYDGSLILWFEFEMLSDYL